MAKFLLYDLADGGFVDANGQRCRNDLADAAIFTEDSAKGKSLNVNEVDYIKFPVTQEFIASIPFDLTDTDPAAEYGDIPAVETEAFTVLTDLGFYGEKFNTSENVSRPKIRGFDFTEATCYTRDALDRTGNLWIMDDGITIPLSDMQQSRLAMNPEFEGFFKEPIGDQAFADAIAALGGDEPEEGSGRNL